MNLAPYIDHTLLKPTATPADIVTLCQEAREHFFKAVCVNPVYIPLAQAELSGSPVLIATVCGFPLGAVLSTQKAAEAAASVNAGAHEVDMVIHVGAALANDWNTVGADIRAVRDATEGAVLKVIIETCFLSDEQKVRASEAALSAGADFVKTSTGFGPGGATLGDVRLMKRVAGDTALIKAAGGIRTRADAEAMIQAGAARLGTSGGVAIVSGQEHRVGY
nr:deoxyribose-phosphate aldolase [Deinococcus peraridilitoris]